MTANTATRELAVIDSYFEAQELELQLQFKGPRGWEYLESLDDLDDAKFLIDEYMMAFKAPESKFRIIAK